MKKIKLFPQYKTTGISREQLLKIMDELHSTSWFHNEDDLQKKDFLELYAATFEKLMFYMENTTYKDNPCAEEHTIVVNILTARQLYLSDIILEYIVDDAHKNLPKICHEIHNYIYDYGNHRGIFNYAELVLLQKIVTLLLKKIRN